MNVHKMATGFAFLLPISTMLAVLAIPIGAVLIIVGLVRYFRPATESAEAVLARRYAAGEIARSEYDALRQDLGLPPLGGGPDDHR